MRCLRTARIGVVAMTLAVLPVFGAGTNRELVMAAWEGKFDEVRRLIEAGVPVNPDPLPEKLATPLYAATHSKQLAMVKYLVERGAQVNVTPPGVGSLSRSPLAGALFPPEPSREIADYLMDQGADPRISTEVHLTKPEYLAATAGFADLFKRMAEAGANWRSIVEPGNRRNLVDIVCQAYVSSVKGGVRAGEGTPEYESQLEDASRYLEILQYMLERGANYRQYSQREAALRVPEGHGFGQCPGLPAE